MKKIGIITFIILLLIFMFYSLFLISEQNECTGISGYTVKCIKKQ